MNAPRVASLAVALLFTTLVDLFAQQGSSLTPGDRVRVSRFGTVAPVVCIVLSMKADTLVLDAEGRVETLEVPLALVEKVEVSRGKESNAGKGAIRGGVVGASFGLVFAGAILLDGGSDKEVVSVAFLAAFTGAGMLVGTAIGAVSSSDRWEEVPLDGIRIGPSSVHHDGLEVSVALRL